MDGRGRARALMAMIVGSGGKVSIISRIHPGVNPPLSQVGQYDCGRHCIHCIVLEQEESNQQSVAAGAELYSTLGAFAEVQKFPR